MIRILSIGSLVKKGTYSSIHSRFDNVINFNTNEQHLLSLCNTHVGGGPCNLVVSDIDFMNICQIKVGQNKITFDKTEILYPEEIITEYYIPETDKDKFLINLTTVKEGLKKYSVEKSLVYLIFNEKYSEFKSTIEINIANKLQKAWELFKNEDIIKSIKLFRGTGIGLTPSGDDFNSGALLAINILNKFNIFKKISIKDIIFETAKGENKIVNTQLYVSKLGMCNEKVHRLLVSLGSNDTQNIENCIRECCNTGETSGSDFMTGFYLVLNYFFYDKRNY